MLTVLTPDASVQLPSTLVATLDSVPPLPVKLLADILPVALILPTLALPDIVTTFWLPA